MSEASLKLLAPEPGDVFVQVAVDELAYEPSLLSRLLIALRLKSAVPDKLVTVDMRLVLETSPHTVFWSDGNDETSATWLAEWHDWVIGAVQVANRGTPLPPEQIEAFTGSPELPFDLTRYQEQA